MTIGATFDASATVPTTAPQRGILRSYLKKKKEAEAKAKAEAEAKAKAAAEWLSQFEKECEAATARRFNAVC